MVQRVAQRAVAFLDARGVPHVLIGGLAAQFWGRARSTLDVDLLVLAEAAQFTSLGQALVAEGFRLRRPDPVSVGDCAVLEFALEDEQALIEVRVDLLTAGTDFHRMIVADGLATELGGASLRVARCEDLIMLKLLAERPIDLVDARELWQINKADLDLPSMQQRADQLGIRGELDACTQA